MAADLDRIHGICKLLDGKGRVIRDMMSVFGRFGLSQTLRRLGLEKQQGVSALQLVISLCLVRFSGGSIFGRFRREFCSMVGTVGGCCCRRMIREAMAWRTLMLRMCIRFFVILRREKAGEVRQSRCCIIGGTTQEKPGLSMEGVSRLFFHVRHKRVLGSTQLLLA